MGYKQELHENKIIEKLKKTNNQSVYTTKLLQYCKSWGGPAVSVEELHDILQKHNDIAENIVQTELSYYRDTHKTEITYRLHLFKVNRIIHDERLINCFAGSEWSKSATNELAIKSRP